MNPENVLPLLIGAILIDAVIIGMNYYRVVFVSDQLTRWYQTCRTSAMAMDVLIIVLYAIGGMRISRRWIGGARCFCHDLFFIVLLQLIGDYAFYRFFQAMPRGTLVFDIFKDYAEEVHVHALWADALMMLGTYCIAWVCTKMNQDTQILALMVAVYVSQYVLYLK